ncbi:MAG TPA: Holliday junction resolvase RuvX [Bryobacteraceae bacterium]|nr:Holliday junction resolvase RuvX [Bryobacteraceae bacterium]
MQENKSDSAQRRTQDRSAHGSHGPEERPAGLGGVPLKRRILALDLGKRRIGLALSDPLGITAQGLPTLERTNLRNDLAALAKIAAEFEVRFIVMGHPLHMSGHEGRQAQYAREFAGRLQARTGLEVRLWDERLTTVEAQRVLRESRIGIEKRAKAVDRLSAQILLQSFLAAQESA